MKKTVLPMLLLLATAPLRPAEARQEPDLEKAAAEWLALLAAEQFDSAAARVATIAQGNMDAAQLATIWPRIIEEFGELEKTAPIDRVEQGGYTIVQLLGTFAKGPRTIRVSFDKDGFVAGFLVLESPAGAGRTPRR